MKRVRATILILLLFTTPLMAGSLALSLGTWNLPPSSEVVSEGTFVQVGGVWSFAPRWEVELFLISEATPHPGGQLLGGSAFTLALIGDHNPTSEVVPSYLNLFLSLGFVGKFETLSPSYGPFIRLSPLAVGGPHFKVRERSLNFSLFYNIPQNKVTFFWNIFLIDLFF